MKRLLEWKQRMLQSPLNRKLPPLVGRAELYKQYPTMPHAHSRQPQYNSYSSDDEGECLPHDVLVFCSCRFECGTDSRL